MFRDAAAGNATLPLFFYSAFIDLTGLARAACIVRTLTVSRDILLNIYVFSNESAPVINFFEFLIRDDRNDLYTIFERMIGLLDRIPLSYYNLRSLLNFKPVYTSSQLKIAEHLFSQKNEFGKLVLSTQETDEIIDAILEGSTLKQKETHQFIMGLGEVPFCEASWLSCSNAKTRNIFISSHPSCSYFHSPGYSTIRRSCPFRSLLT